MKISGIQKAYKRKEVRSWKSEDGSQEAEHSRQKRAINYEGKRSGFHSCLIQVFCEDDILLF